MIKGSLSGAKLCKGGRKHACIRGVRGGAPRDAPGDSVGLGDSRSFAGDEAADDDADPSSAPVQHQRMSCWGR